MQLKIFFKGTEYTATGRNSIIPDATEALGLNSLRQGMFTSEYIIIYVPDDKPRNYWLERLAKLGVKAVLQSSTHALYQNRATPRDKPKRRRT